MRMAMLRGMAIAVVAMMAAVAGVGAGLGQAWAQAQKMVVPADLRESYDCAAFSEALYLRYERAGDAARAQQAQRQLDGWLSMARADERDLDVSAARATAMRKEVAAVHAAQLGRDGWESYRKKWAIACE